MKIVYSDIDNFACKWLEKLIEYDQLLPGRVVKSCITQITEEVIGDCDILHLFCGIGGWPLALEMAGIPKNIKILTGSCPCQPFSSAGLGLAEFDDRHLWPEMRRIIDVWNPSIVFGEQVAGKLGIEWFDNVRYDLETRNYAVGMAVLPAFSANAFHKRERIFYVAYNNSHRLQKNWRHGELYVPIKWRNENINITCPSIYDISVKQSEFDSKWYYVPSGYDICSVANAIPNYVGRVRGFGNAIVPTLAAKFVKSAWQAIGDYDA
jgi:DNA (cytosine-5)-methyltransferase 1